MDRAMNVAKNAASSIMAIKHLYQSNLNISVDEALAYERDYTSSTVPRQSELP